MLIFELFLLFALSLFFIKKSASLDVKIIYIYLFICPFIQFLKALSLPYGFLFWGLLREVLIISMITGLLFRHKYIQRVRLTKKAQNLFFFLAWGIVLVFLTIFNRDVYSALDGYRYFFFPWLFGLVIFYFHSNEAYIDTKKIIKTFYWVALLAVSIQWFEYFFLNIFDNVPQSLTYVNKRYPGYDSSSGGDFMSPFGWAKSMGIHFYRGYGIFLQPQTTSIFLAMLGVFFFKIRNNNYIKLNPINILFIYSGSFITFGWLGILSLIFTSILLSLNLNQIKSFLVSFSVVLIGLYLLDLEIVKFAIYYITSTIVDVYIDLMLFDINQYINASNFLTFNVGHGFFAGELLKRDGLNTDSFAGETFILRFVGQIGLFGLLIISSIIIKALISNNFQDKNINYAFKGIIIVTIISTLHYAAIRLTGVSDIFVASCILLTLNQNKETS